MYNEWAMWATDTIDFKSASEGEAPGGKTVGAQSRNTDIKIGCKAEQSRCNVYTLDICNSAKQIK